MSTELQYCEDTSRIVMQLEREFDMIERKYNKLIEQKTDFCKACAGPYPLHFAGGRQ